VSWRRGDTGKRKISLWGEKHTSAIHKKTRKNWAVSIRPRERDNLFGEKRDSGRKKADFSQCVFKREHCDSGNSYCATIRGESRKGKKVLNRETIKNKGKISTWAVNVSHGKI